MTSSPSLPPPVPVAFLGRIPPMRRLWGWGWHHRAPISLVVLAIVIPEVLTGSTPVYSLLDPISVLGLLGFYGCGVLLIRDLSLRWRNGWSAILLLGLAYGIAEEGIATKTMVDPKSPVVGLLGGYGHFLGVNWVFAVVIDLFHAVFSIGLPILLVNLTYPEQKQERFLTDRGLRWDLFLFALSVLLGFLFFDRTYFEGYAVLGFLLACVAGLVCVARYAPATWTWPSTQEPQRTPRWFLGLGLLWVWAWFFFYIPGPRLFSAPIVPILGEVIVTAIVLYLLVREFGRIRNELQSIYFAMGVLSWYIPWALILTLLQGDFLVWAFLLAVYCLLFLLKERYGGTDPTSPAPITG